MNWQPTLIGPTLRLRPMVEGDFDALFAVASDPLIWEQHPDRERYTLDRFKVYFQGGLDCQGGLVVHDLKTDKIIGASRFSDHDPNKLHVAIGFSFLAREYWGGKSNLEMKTLMLDYAFQFVETVYFVVGHTNLRSQKAMAKIGGILANDVKSTVPTEVIFAISKSDWVGRRID